MSRLNLVERLLPPHLSEEASVLLDDFFEWRLRTGNPVKCRWLFICDYYLRAIVHYNVCYLFDHLVVSRAGIRLTLDRAEFWWTFGSIKIRWIYDCAGLRLEYRSSTSWRHYFVGARVVNMIRYPYFRIATLIGTSNAVALIFVIPARLMLRPFRYRILRAAIAKLDRAIMSPEDASWVDAISNDLASGRLGWRGLFASVDPTSQGVRILCPRWAHRARRAAVVPFVVASDKARAKRWTWYGQYVSEIGATQLLDAYDLYEFPVVRLLHGSQISAYMEACGRPADERYLLDLLDGHDEWQLSEFVATNQQLAESLREKSTKALPIG
jgi:hypothetical protein